MMGSPEWTGGHQHGAALEFTRHGMDFSGLQRLAERERWQNGGKSFGHHRLAGSGRAYEQNIMAARTGYFESPLYVFLPFYIGKSKSNEA